MTRGFTGGSRRARGSSLKRSFLRVPRVTPVNPRVELLLFSVAVAAIKPRNDKRRLSAPLALPATCNSYGMIPAAALGVAYAQGCAGSLR